MGGLGSWGITSSLRGRRSPQGGGYPEAQLLGGPLEAMVRAQDCSVRLTGTPDKELRRENSRTETLQWKQEWHATKGQSKPAAATLRAGWEEHKWTDGGDRRSSHQKYTDSLRSGKHAQSALRK